MPASEPGPLPLVLLVLVGLVAATCGGQDVSQPDRPANDSLRQALRTDPAFELIPAGVRASMKEILPQGGGFSGPQTGEMGWDGTEPWDGTGDPQALIVAWDGRIQPLGWSPAGGLCIRGPDPRMEQVAGLWGKTIRGTRAWFDYGVANGRIEYGLFIKPVDDRTGNGVPGLDRYPAPLGCGPGSTP